MRIRPLAHPPARRSRLALRFGGAAFLLTMAGATRGAGSTAEVVAHTEVAIREDAFTPSPRTIRAGTRVTWVNYDVAPHTAKSGAGLEQWDSGVLPANASFSRTFGTPGRYQYRCADDRVRARYRA